MNKITQSDARVASATADRKSDWIPAAGWSLCSYLALFLATFISPLGATAATDGGVDKRVAAIADAPRTAAAVRRAINSADLPWDNRYIVRFKSSAVPLGQPVPQVTTPAVTTKRLASAASGAVVMQQARSMVAAQGGHVRLELPAMNALAVQLTPEQRDRLAADPAVERVEIDPPRYPLAQQVPYGIPLVQSDQVPYGGAPGITVCVVDSGFDLGHPDLPGGTRVTGEAAPGIGPWFEDGSGHGTHVAGTIMALANTEGVIGATNGGEFAVHIYRVFPDEDTPVSSSDVITGVQSCANAGARVVNLSLGCTGNGCFSATEQEAFAGFASAGILAVAAAGNDGEDPVDGTAPSYPAAYPSVVAVGAIDEASELAGFSQRYPEVELAAPGVAVTSTVPRGTGFGSDVAVALQSFPSDALSFSATGDVTAALADCGIGDSVCTNVTGLVCLIQRGTVLFADKARNCEAGGGIGAVIYNNVPGSFLGTLGANNGIGIPVAGVSDTDGASLQLLLGQQTSLAVGPRDYGEKNGTSMATPHVAGVAALVWSRAPEQSNAQIRAALQSGALDLGAPGRDNLFGFGLVQAASSVAQLNGDADGDGVNNPQDNCPLASNADQSDADDDGSGDACDDDVDGDGMSNVYETEHALNPLLSDGLGDQDNDGFSNLAEFYAASSSSDAASTPQNDSAPVLVAAVLPTSRSALVGEPITAFATLINTSSQPGQNCSVAPLSPLPAAYEFFATDAQTNESTGFGNTRVNVAASGSVSFLLQLTPGGAFDPLELPLRFGCDNLGTATVVDGLNTLLVSASNTAVPDVVALAATASRDGVVRTNATGAGAFGVASINLGSAANLTVSAAITNTSVPVAISLCPTDATGACLQEAAAQVTVAIGANATPTFSVFVQAGEEILFDPAGTRIRVSFTDGLGQVRGATSVAIVREN